MPEASKELEAARRLRATLKHMVRWWDQLKPADIDWAKEDLEETAWVEENPKASVDTKGATENNLSGDLARCRITANNDSRPCAN